MTLALRYAVRSDVGLLREGNEDSAYAGPRLLAIADGMGGHAAGEVASAVTIGALAELDKRQPGTDMLADLANAVTAANMRLQQIVTANPAVEGMGTTLTAVLWSDGHAAVCHIGDSRGYLLRDGELYQITHDHTLVQSLIDEGRITEDDASTHPQRSLILRAIDGRTVADPDLSQHESQRGDRYLLCSDGLSGVVSDETLRDTLAEIGDPEACTRQLIDLALRGGGPDNITCIVADVVDPAAVRMPPLKPVLAGAAVNGTDPRGFPATPRSHPSGPFTTMTAVQPAQPIGPGGPAGPGPGGSGAGGPGAGGASRVATTAPQPVLTDTDDDPSHLNGTAPEAHRSHRRQRGSSGGSGGGRSGSGRSGSGEAGGGATKTRRRWPIVTTALVVLVVVVAGGGYLAWQYSQDQYYVAVDKNQVTIYRGINDSVLGISLSHPYHHTGITISQVPADFRQQLTSTITASNLGDAQKVVTNVQGQVNQCHQWYTQLVTWQKNEQSYQTALAAARKAHHPTASIKGPGAQPPPLAITCPAPAEYNIDPASLPAGTS